MEKLVKRFKRSSGMEGRFSKEGEAEREREVGARRLA